VLSNPPLSSTIAGPWPSALAELLPIAPNCIVEPASENDMNPQEPAPRESSTAAHAQYWQALRNLGVAGRARLIFDLSESLRRITESGIRHRHPDYNDRQVRLAATKLTFGPVLFKQVYPNEDIDP
jgi:hypothetical protein